MRFKDGKHLKMPSSLRSKVADILRGATLRDAARLDYSWAFEFTSGSLTTGSVWRLISGGRLILASDDDRHQFGLPEPLDAEAAVRAALAGRRVRAVEADPATADLRIEFENATRMEVISTSVGYEAWQLNSPGSCIVAGNEGRLSEAVEHKPGLLIGGPWE